MSQLPSNPSPHLFSPLTIQGVTLRNRIGLSPMCQYSSEDGLLNDWHLAHLGARAAGGAGLIIIEATGVEPRGRITPADAGLWSDRQIEPLARVCRFLRQQGAAPGIQLAHAGRKASTARPWDGGQSLSDAEGGWETLGPSPLAFGAGITRAPRAMTLEDIRTVQEAFRAATVRALAAGVEWLELHAAHGYLLHSFYSPLANQRQDQYGGSFANRVRLTVETARLLRQAWPAHYPFTVRLSCTDWVPGGWTLEDSIGLARLLQAEGVDLIDCSSGFNAPEMDSYPFGPSFQAPLAGAIRQGAGLRTACVGCLTQSAQADAIIRNGQADLVLLGREMLRNPNWALQAARQLNHTQGTQPPVQYARAIR